MRDDVRLMQRSDRSDDMLTLDWASVGRLVRRTTLEAVAIHFAELGVQSMEPAATATTGRIEESQD